MRVAIFGPFHGGGSDGAGTGASGASPLPEPKAGGVEQHVHYLSESLEKKEVEVERWSWKVKGDVGGIRKANLFRLGNAFRDANADILHLHATATVFSWPFGFGNKRPVATIHSFFHHEYETTARMKVMSTFLAVPYVRALRRIGDNIAVSSSTKSEADGFGVPVKQVIGNGIPLKQFEKVRGDQELESDVMMVGRFTEQKGVFDFVKAFSNSGLDVVLAGYGDRATEERLRRTCELGRIRFLPNMGRKELLATIKATKVFAFPSKYEPFGIVGLEAMALGKPVVVYRAAGGPLDYVRDGVNGRVVESSPEELLKASKEVLGDSGAYKRLSANALKTAGEFDWDRVAERVKEFYKKVLEVREND